MKPAGVSGFTAASRTRALLIWHNWEAVALYLPTSISPLELRSVLGRMRTNLLQRGCGSAERINHGWRVFIVPIPSGENFDKQTTDLCTDFNAESWYVLSTITGLLCRRKCLISTSTALTSPSWKTTRTAALTRWTAYTGWKMLQELSLPVVACDGTEYAFQYYPSGSLPLYRPRLER